MTEGMRKKLEIGLWCVFAVSLAIAVGAGAMWVKQRLEPVPVPPSLRKLVPSLATSGQETLSSQDAGPTDYTGPIINAHDHIQSFNEAPKFIEAMDRVGIAKTVLLGSSWFTMTLNPRVGFTRYDWNNEQLMRIVEEYPERFEAWPTVNPEDPEKLEKFKSLVERGARGLKLYLGHGYVNPTNGEYLFHTMALDDPRMMPLYEYCENNFVPVCFHVNPGPKTPGFAEEFVAVLDKFPDMKVNCPHFMLSSIKDSRLRELLDRYPNLYTDVSFGADEFLRAGLRRVSRNPAKFRKLYSDYPDRFMFGTDMVVTASRQKSVQWIVDRCQVYIDMLTKQRYTTPILPGEQLRGVALSDELLHRIFHENFEEFMAKKPVGTQLGRPIKWRNMGVDRVERKPGETLPPLQK